MRFIKARVSGLYCEEVGVGPPILLIHPAGAAASTWGPVVGDLARVGRLIAYDRRGYARSGGEVVRSASTHTGDAIAVLEALEATPVVVVGTSAGATLALDLAVRRPDLVRAVVAHESPWRAMRHPTASGLGTLARVQWRGWRGQYAEAAETLLRYVYRYRDGGSAWDAFPDDWRRIGRESGRSVLADLRSTMGSYPRVGDLATITSPVVCTHGSRSGRYMRSITRSLARAIPTATVREIDGAAHAVAFDAPVAFVQVVVQAIGSTKSRSAT
jgi:pimeloyl-ACP methyl ester carboxylesterase